MRRGIINDHLIAYSLSNISANNYQNRLMCVEVIVCNISVVFLTHIVRRHSIDNILDQSWRFTPDCQFTTLNATCMNFQSCQGWLTTMTTVCVIGLYCISAPALAEILPFLQIRPKSNSGQNIAGFQFLAGFAKWRIQILQCSIFQLVQKTAQSMMPYLQFVCLLCWDLATSSRDWGISHYEYRSSSFMNKSQIQPRLDLCSQIQFQPDLQNLNLVQPWSAMCMW